MMTSGITGTIQSIPGMDSSPHDGPTGIPMGVPRVHKIEQSQYDQGIDAITQGLAMTSLSGNGARASIPDAPPFNHAPLAGQPFSRAQSNGLTQYKSLYCAEDSPRNQQSFDPTGGWKGPLNAGGGPQATWVMAHTTTGSSITTSFPSTVVNSTEAIGPVKQPTKLSPEVPAPFLTPEFIESVARTLDDFDTQALFRPDDSGIDFERDFREWFNPDDLEFETGDLDTETLFRPGDTGINFEQDFREWFNPDDLDMK